MFKYNPGVHDEDDIIEYILNELIKPEWAGGCLQVPDFCRTPDSYDRFMEQTVRQKMYNYQVAQRCTGFNQPETAIIITTKGIKVARNGGWKAYLNTEAERKKAEKKQLEDRELAIKERERFEAERDKLEKQKITLEIEQLNYERQNRELNEKVNHLTTVNLKLQNAEIVGKWIYGFLGILVTMCTSVILESKFQTISSLTKVLARIWSSTD
ncbi:hypothetical protein MUK70_08560 [Dyadobacter chenwenxiniae]|uniref:Uncharacterized protein n=1 Tax=Dyadobacter chenwenxiniae TaxID=2906456 RepID=A0A9X1PL55_9BACT|nr:hypothetical protein [Dyadobacter chenwenxiniae]MCF0062791.1 hypothetical protein [Dyadobacter chenwenxiniae]UON85034.1 hypothetical protein MUK70_08560 [Dyadobacter chenwenxiniae]